MEATHNNFNGVYDVMNNSLEDDLEKIILSGKNFVLQQSAYCYQILTKDGHQVYGSYSIDTAKKKYFELETKYAEMKDEE